MEKLYVVIPAYNESENIRACVNDWYPVVESHNTCGGSRLVIVNDGSKDDTWEILKELAGERPLLVPLTKENGGHGSAVLFGYRYAIGQGADVIFQTDSDGQTDPREFEQFWRAMRAHDAVLGNRVDRRDGRGRKLVERGLVSVLRRIFGVKIPDANAPFRLMRAGLVKKYLPLLAEDYELPNVMLTTFFAYYRERITFLPVSFRPRQAGNNSIDMKKIIAIARRSMRSFRKIRSKMPPR